MRRPLLVVTIVCLASLAGAFVSRAPSAPTAHARSACGIERWAVKTLTDKDSRRLPLRPKRVSIFELTSLPQPSGITYRRTHDAIELQVLRISAVLREARNEDDQDLHLIVVDPRHPSVSMVVEFPAPACTQGAPAKLRGKMKAARAAFVRSCGGAGVLHGTATITGVGFWDRPHATGAAPNGIELHPVLGFIGTCRDRL